MAFVGLVRVGSEGGGDSFGVLVRCFGSVDPQTFLIEPVRIFKMI